MFTIPLELKAALTFLLTQGIKAFVKLFGKTLGGASAALVAVVVSTFLFFGEGLIGLIEPKQQDAVVTVLSLLLLIFTAFGIHYTTKSLAGK